MIPKKRCVVCGGPIEGHYYQLGARANGKLYCIHEIPKTDRTLENEDSRFENAKHIRPKGMEESK